MGAKVLPFINQTKETCQTPKEIEKRLQESGVQPTLHRIAICRFVLCEADHPTAEDVHNWAEKNLDKISLATVYNTLRALVQAKMLNEFRFPNNDKIVFDSNMDDHHHFYDLEKDTLHDVHLDQVKINTEMGKMLCIDKVSVFIAGKVASPPKSKK